MDNTERAAVAETAVKAFMHACRTDREDAVGDLICNLMHLAEADGDDPLVIVKNAISHHFAETHHERAATVEITVKPTLYSRPAPKYSELVKVLGEVRNLVSSAVVAANSEPDTLAENMGAIFDLVFVPETPKNPLLTPAPADAPLFDIEFSFSMSARAYGYQMRAKDQAEAEQRAALAIKNGVLDIEKFEAIGGDASKSTWSTKGGEDSDYEVSDVTEA